MLYGGVRYNLDLLVHEKFGHSLRNVRSSVVVMELPRPNEVRPLLRDVVLHHLFQHRDVVLGINPLLRCQPTLMGAHDPSVIEKGYDHRLLGGLCHASFLGRAFTFLDPFCTLLFCGRIIGINPILIGSVDGFPTSIPSLRTHSDQYLRRVTRCFFCWVSGDTVSSTHILAKCLNDRVTAYACFLMKYRVYRPSFEW